MKAVSFRKVVLVLCLFCIPMGIQAQQTVTTTGGTTGYIPKFSGAATVVKSQIFDNGTNVGIGVGANPNSGVKLDIGGQMIVRGTTIVSRTGNATASKGFPSYGFEFFSNAYNSSTKASDNPYFSLQSEPTGNNTASPSATFNLLFSNNGAAAAETGFYINTNGTLHFAAAQTFPIAAGPQGPAGPKGATGATGATGAAGPAGSVALPYSGSANGSGGYLFSVTDTGSFGGGAIYGSGAAGVVSNQATIAGAGVTGLGGTSANDPNNAAAGAGVSGTGGATSDFTGYAGPGVVGLGGSGLSYNNAGDGGDFTGGGGSAGGNFTGNGGGNGIYAVGGSAGDSDGGAGIIAVGGFSYGIGTYGDAGDFEGDVHISGNLSKSGGSFKIDDPLDPANKYLYHSFVESPDMKNIYDGTVVTDGRGEAVVKMPDYFEALNRDFRYQLTIVGEQFAQARIATKMSNGVFVIKTDKSNIEVSWQVTGVRQDAWANAHRIPIEEDKPAKEKGHYTHPELFGHEGEASIAEMKHPRPHSSRSVARDTARQ